MGAWARPSFSFLQQLSHWAARVPFTGARLIGLKGLCLLGLLASLSSQVASVQTDAGFVLSLGEGVEAKRGMMTKDQRLRGVKSSPQKVNYQALREVSHR